MVSRSIVEHEVNGSALAVRKPLSEELEEGHKVLTVGAFRQHEEWRGEQCTDRANHGDTVASVLVKDDLHWLVYVHPRRSHLDPHVERRLISVNHYRLLLNQLS